MNGAEAAARTKPLRLAVLIDQPDSPAPWVLRLLERICGSPQLELCCLLEPAGSQAAPRGNRLFHAWRSLEERLAARTSPAHCPAFAAVRGRLPTLRVDQDASIRVLGLDVVLDLTGGCSCSPTWARHGIWFLDFLSAEAGVAGLQAIIGPEPVTRVSLFRRATGDSEPLAIATAVLNTKFIAARNALFMCEKAVPLVVRELQRTQRTGCPNRLAGLAFRTPDPPRLRDFARYVAGMVAESAARVTEQILARLSLRPGMFYLKSAAGDVLTFDPARADSHVASGNAYYADPFLWEHDGECYCFFEVYDYAARKGHIGVGRFADGELVDVRQALTTDYHLSFPFLFEDEGTLYMMPETCGARRIEIWRCLEFPDRWERHSTALDGVMAADSTLTKIDGAWWLFTNISTDPFGEMNSELHLFRADGPAMTSLVPHPLNPVVFDSRTARNAGRILEKDGLYYRPSQNNSHGLYGYGLNLMRIDCVTGEDYAETAVRRIEPDVDNGIIGCHHVDTRSGRIIMDVRKKLGGW